MSIGLLALLDDVAALVKVSAASLDDIPTQIAKTTGKVSGIVIDDAAVTPKYVVGLDPARELSIIFQIAKKSLINKLVFLGPAALILGFFAPWIIQPLLMIGGAYLCFEGYEKVHSIFSRHHAENEQPETMEIITPEELEKERVKGAVRTDFILSAEIIAITYYSVADKDVMTQIAVMLCVTVLITAAVYGFVGMIVKTDDIGLHLAKKKNGTVQKIGRSIVLFMPHFLTILGYVGTAAMLWVGAEIIVHGIPMLHHGLDDLLHVLPPIPALVWFIKVCVCALGGIMLGALIEKCVHAIRFIIQRSTLNKTKT